MLETLIPGQGEPEELLVRRYLASLSNGRFIDALNTFSMDASFRDESGRERHGIREIAAAFARRERPMTVEIEDLRLEGETVAVRVRMRHPAGGASKLYRNVFRVRRDRIHSLEVNPLPASRSRRVRPSRRA